ncbi:patatin-like phospholipase family protein [Streptomyces sp. E2N166]|uniref:patatin-like phospholipase family protein n=1 Tax=Streptomyces sp. E2N166 TaxID=1851909 RepID=UPI001EE9A343|nr:patatin-like phospholipase family protein [Streptomyces sp. E2N166]
MDLAGADVLTGTSAGSLPAPDLAGGSAPAGLYAERVERKRTMLDVDFTCAMTVKYLWAALGSRDPRTVVERIGRLAALTVRDVQETEVFEAIAPQLPTRTWPQKPVRLFVVDALTGEPTAFTADSDVDLPHTMSATCAPPPLFPPITIGTGRWKDGGVRSATGRRRTTSGPSGTTETPWPGEPTPLTHTRRPRPQRFRW